MQTEYLNPTGSEMHDRINHDVCAWCGSAWSLEGCFCRHCDSCSQYWKANVRKDVSDGCPCKEDCPECERLEAENSAPLASVHANEESTFYPETLGEQSLGGAMAWINLQKRNEQRITQLEAALREAKDVIRIWHGEEGYDIYDQHSPEMKRINRALVGTTEQETQNQ